MRHPLHFLGLFAVAWTVTGGGALAADSFGACVGLFPGGVIPKAVSGSVVDICKTANDEPLFAIRFDTGREIPVWTVHRLTPEHIATIDANSGKMKRPKFKPDGDLPRDRQAVDKSYVRSGFARGHIVPANDMSWAKAAYDATFTFANVVPQKQVFNNGTWRGMEDAFRALVKEKNATLWAISGVYGETRPPQTIGTSPHAPSVPACFYKIIIAEEQSDAGPAYKVLAGLFRWDDQRKRTAWPQGVSTLALIEERSGLDFLAGLRVDDGDAAYWGEIIPPAPADCP